MNEPAEAGQWSRPVDWSEMALASLITCEVPPCNVGPGFLGTHAVHLPTGKILLWDGVENQYLWSISDETFEYVPAVYPRNGCAFDGLVDCLTDTDCAEYCALVGDGNDNCVPDPPFTCAMGTCTLDNSITCTSAADCESYCDGAGAETPECNPPPDLTCDTTVDPAELFCAGHTHGTDGTVTVIGGNVTGSFSALGKKEIAQFTTGEEWQRIEDVQLKAFRWYPSAIQLGDGRIFVLGGDGFNVAEIYDPQAAPADAVSAVGFHPGDTFDPENRNALLYPFIFQIQLGLVFSGGGEGLGNNAYWAGYLFDTQVENTWVTNFGSPSTTPGGSAVLYEKGKIMKSGGCTSGGNRCQPNAITEIIDLSSVVLPVPNNTELVPHPKWTPTCPMTHPRHFHTLTLLPDGKVVATGGNTDGNGHMASYCSGGTGLAQCKPNLGDADCTAGRCSNSPNFQSCDMMNPCPLTAACFVAGGTCETYDNADFSVKSAEMWDPVEKTWTELASQDIPRMYHSTALLLPDGRVLSAGGGKRTGLISQFNAEFYSPPYLFQGPRPALANVPATISIGIAFEVTLDDVDSSDIERVTLIRLGSVTHQFDMDQRFIELDHAVMTPSMLRVFAPASVNVAPPGWYMLFVLDDGVPSIGRYVQVLE